MTSHYHALPDADAEAEIYAEMQSFDSEQRLRYAQIGIMAQAVEKRMLWRFRTDPETDYPCRSMSRWIRMACPYAYSTVYSAWRDVEALADVPAEEIAQIPQANFSTMKQLSGGVRKRPEVLRVAKTQSNDELVSYIQKHYPSLHLEQKRTLRFNPDESAAEKINATLDRVMERHACNRNEALEWMAIAADQVLQMESEVESSRTDSRNIEEVNHARLPT